MSACALPSAHSAAGSAAAVLDSDGGAASLVHLLSRIEATDSSAHSPVSSNALASFPLTADCLCTAVGPVRCLEGAFRAHVHGHDDVIAALTMLRGGNVSGPARIFCDALGPVRCSTVVNSEGSDASDAVGLLWRVLQGERVSEAPLASTGHMLSLDSSDFSANRSAIDEPLYQLRSILRSLRVAHLPEGAADLVSSTSLRDALSSSKNKSSSSAGPFLEALHDSQLQAVLAGWSNTTWKQLLRDAGAVLLPVAPTVGHNGTFVLAYSLALAQNVSRRYMSLFASRNLPRLMHYDPDDYGVGVFDDNTTSGVVVFDSGSLYDYLQAAGTIASHAQFVLATQSPVLAAPPVPPYPGAVRLGTCTPAFEHVTPHSCLSFEGSCSLLRPGFNASVYAAYWQFAAGAASVSKVVHSVVDLPRTEAELSPLERAMRVGGRDSMDAAVTNGQAASSAKDPESMVAGGYQRLSPGSGLSDAAIAEYDAQRAAGLIDPGRDAVDEAVAATRLRAGIPVVTPTSDSSSPDDGAVTVGSGSIDRAGLLSLYGLPIVRNRIECESTFSSDLVPSDACIPVEHQSNKTAEPAPSSAAGRRGKWTSQNTFVPFLHPIAMGAGIRSLSFRAVRDMLTSGLGDANAFVPIDMLVPPIPVIFSGLDSVGLLVRGRQCNISANECVREPTAQPLCTIDDRLDVLRSATSSFIVDAAPSGGTSILHDSWPCGSMARRRNDVNISDLLALLSFNGTSIPSSIEGLATRLVATSPRGETCSPCTLSRQLEYLRASSSPVSDAAERWANLGCPVLFSRPLDVIVAVSSGVVPAEGDCVLSPHGCLLKPPTGRVELPADRELAALRAMSELFVKRRATSSAPQSRALAVRWMRVNDAGRHLDDDLTLGDDHTNKGHAQGGTVSDAEGRWPWWRCKRRELDGGGCPDDDPSASSSGGPDNASCDPTTGDGCECVIPEPPTSLYVCDESTRKRRKRMVSISNSRKFNKVVSSDAARLKSKNKKGQKVEAPKRCDPNPFTNLL
jgi:hypothetical protein